MSVISVTLEEEMKKNPELKKEDLDNLKEWLQKQPHLPSIPDLDLILFLHSCYWSVERCKQTIDSYYTIRTHSPLLFSHRDPTHVTVTKPMDIVNCIFIGNKNVPDEVVFYGKLINTDYSILVFTDCLKFFFHVQDIALQEYGTFGKLTIVMDVEGMSLGHLTKLDITTMKTLLLYLQQAMPVRLKSIHFIHPVPFMDKLMTLLRPFLNPDMANMIHIHTQLDAFLQIMDHRLIPKDIGGQAPSLEQIQNEWKDKVLRNGEFFKLEEKRRVDEKRRVKKETNEGQVFGLEGSFKKLDID